MKKILSFLSFLFCLVMLHANTNKLLILTFGTIQANQIGGYVVVTWQTLSETDNDYFSIERSTDSIIFTPVGVVGSIGNTTSLTTYNFTDSTANINQTYYYRIKQVDLDAAYTYSSGAIYDPFAGVDELDNKLKITVSVFPNPACNKVTISWDQAYQKDYKLVVFDINGKQMLSLPTKLINIIIFDVSMFPRGTYFFQLLHGQQVVSSGNFTKE